jgi:hypothetical protein
MNMKNDTLKIGDICHYPVGTTEKSKSLALVEIVDFTDDPREVAVIKVLDVINDDTGNGYLAFLKRTGKTMNVTANRCAHHTKLHASNDWGLFVSLDEVKAHNLDEDKLMAEEFVLIKPISGYVYFDAAGEYRSAKEPFWFLPLAWQGGLFAAPYRDIDDIEDELEDVYPEVFELDSVANRLCRVNVVYPM